MDESTLLNAETCVQISHFPGWTCMQSRVRAQEEKCYSWSESTKIANCFLVIASFASFFLISWQKPSRLFATTVEHYLEIFHGVNFQRSKSLVGKTLNSLFTKNLRKPRSFSHCETFVVYSIYLSFVHIYIVIVAQHCIPMHINFIIRSFAPTLPFSRLQTDCMQDARLRFLDVFNCLFCQWHLSDIILMPAR